MGTCNVSNLFLGPFILMNEPSKNKETRSYAAEREEADNFSPPETTIKLDKTAKKIHFSALEIDQRHTTI